MIKKIERLRRPKKTINEIYFLLNLKNIFYDKYYIWYYLLSLDFQCINLMSADIKYEISFYFKKIFIL